MINVALAMFLMLTLVAALPQHHVAAMEPIAPDWVSTCKPNTVPIEAQAWWISDFGHVHAGFCAPQGQTITGQYTFNIRLTLHDNPGTLKHVQGQLDSSSYGGQTVKVNTTCPNQGTCSWDKQVTVNTAAFPYDGWHHIRIRATVVEPDGKELVVSSFVPVYFKNGKVRKDFNQAFIGGTNDYVSGRGWYTEQGYSWSSVFDPKQVGQRVNGIYKVKVRSHASGNSMPVSRFIVKMDATHDAEGSVLYDVPYEQSSPTEIQIDTRRLANGWHSLLARTETAGLPGGTCAVCSGNPQTSAGVTKVWFYVQN